MDMDEMRRSVNWDAVFNRADNHDDRVSGVVHEWDYLDDPFELAARRGSVGARLVA